mgnify:CR=1 FL=1
MMRVLGVDTSLRSTGVAVIEVDGRRLTKTAYKLVKSSRNLPASQCLHHLYTAIVGIIARQKPDAAAVEGIFYCRNIKTAVSLGEARGAVKAACAAGGVPVYEYTPRFVKQAVTGRGAASKEQVGKMVMLILNLDDMPQEDVSDALAIAICHIHRMQNLPLQTLKEM